MEIVNAVHAPKAIGPYSQGVPWNELIFSSGQIPIEPTTGKWWKVTLKDKLSKS